ncbi:MAG: DUF3482 domain-containing protein [Pseudohongiella sp.]|uniref:GTPase/DUF3482 domain-containing protein n=1 Tax=Pseudohongiella sp. TaxID=1979412 RepID=UPI0034A0532A
MSLDEHLLKAIDEPLRITVAGHTNTGKTSLLRTLTRDARFGEVSGRPGTTRHVEAARLLVKGRVLLELFDTPGMEEPIDLLALLGQQASGTGNEDGRARIRRFLETEPAQTRFEQEAKVLRQLMKSDAAFYVLDARDPVLAKHRDELEILRLCGVPLLPLLNFVADPGAREDEWRDALAGLGLHAIVRFDTVAPTQDGERLLYSKLANLLDAHSNTLNALIASHAEDAHDRHQSALMLIAELLIEVAALQQRVSSLDAQELEKASVTLNDRVRAREQESVERLLSLYRFYPDDIENAALPLVEGRWQQDLFDPYTLQAMGLKLGSGAAAGAVAGVGIDLMVGGITLGLATAIGALLGGGLQTLRHYGSHLMGLISGEKILRIDDNILRALAARQCHLLQALESRGHAAQHKIMAADAADTVFAGQRLPASLRQAQANPDWAHEANTKPSFEFEDRRQYAIDELAQILATKTDTK